MEYRANYLTDIIVQPLVVACIEMALWMSVFASVDSLTIGGFDRNHYLSYAIWASFITRVTTNWMYEYRMVNDVESGAINSILVRPVSFYEYYLGQFVGYKLTSLAFSSVVPIFFSFLFNLSIIPARIPAVFCLIGFYLILLHTLSFLISCMAFKLTRVTSLTIAKNLTLWVLSGELYPLDLLPSPLKEWIIALPFSSAVYLPVAYLTGRIESASFYQGFLSVGIGIVFFAWIGQTLWRRGLLSYTGTGA